MIKLLMLLLTSVFLILFFHLGCARIFKNQSRLGTAMGSILFGQGVSLGVLFYFFPFRPEISLFENLSLGFYICLMVTAIGYIYFHFFNTSETARRPRILFEFVNKGKLSESEIISLRESEDILGPRLKRLLELGQLTKINHQYYLKGKILYRAALLVSWIRRCLRL